MTRLLSIALLALTTCALWSCSREPASPDQQPDAVRVVVLSPALASMMRSLSLDHAIVGRHNYDRWTDTTIPACGDNTALDYEMLLSVRPDVVLIEESAQPTPGRLLELAGEKGWAVRRVAVLTLSDVRAAFTSTWNAVVRDAGAEPGEPDALRAALAEFDEACAPNDDRWPDEGGILIAMPGRTLGVLGPGSYHQELLERIGGIPAISQGAPFISMDAEDVAELAPRAIVLIHTAEPGAEPNTRLASDAESEALLGAVTRLGVPAVDRGLIAIVDHPLAIVPGADAAAVARELARAIELIRERASE